MSKEIQITVNEIDATKLTPGIYIIGLHPRDWNRDGVEVLSEWLQQRNIDAFLFQSLDKDSLTFYQVPTPSVTDDLDHDMEPSH